ncbi:MAG: recombinase family protein [Elusimicrobia bacterium]|nr:recombinase family protein [Candidatus Liberimonas magnetica]
MLEPNPKQKVKVALYARVSTEEQTNNYSLDAQKDLLIKYAKENNFVITGEYIDGGYSGTSDDRPEFQKMMEDARGGKFNLVLFYKYDRLFRNNRHLLNTVEQLSQYGVAIKSITEPFDTSNPMGKCMVSILGSMAELERNNFLERSKQGKLRRYREGYYAGSGVFGYDYDKETDILTINTNEAEIVKHIFSEYIQPESSLLKVARNLRKQGLKTKKGLEFQSHCIHGILLNSMYTGKWYANRLGPKNSLKPRDLWIEVKVPAIVSEEEYNLAHKLLKERRIYSKRNVKYDYLLQGLIKCGACGSKISGTSDSSLPTMINGRQYGPYFKLYYRCNHYSKNLFEKKISCDLRWIQSELIDGAVWNKADIILNNPEIIRKAVERERESMPERDVLQKSLKKNEDALKRLCREEERIIEAYRRNIISIEQLDQQISDIRLKKEAYSHEIERIGLLLEDKKENIESAIDCVSQINKGIGKLNPDIKKRVLRLLDTSVVVNTNGKANLTFRIPLSLPESFPPIMSAEHASHPHLRICSSFHSSGFHHSRQALVSIKMLPRRGIYP